MKIAMGNDHAAVDLKMQIMEYVKELGHEVINFGTDTKERCNYPEYGEKVCLLYTSSSMLVTHVAAPKAGDYVIDVCSCLLYTSNMMKKNLKKSIL